MYRTKLAQTAHEAIVSYIRDEIASDEVISAIKALNNESLRELSKNGHSHLTDIMHLSFEIEKDQESATKKCVLMIKTLLDQAFEVDKDAFCFLLKQTGDLDFTPMHSIMISNSPESVRIYLNEVRYAIGKKLMNPREYASLLLSPNQEGFTPLHSALASGNSENVRAYLAEVRYAIDKNRIKHGAYVALLLSQNKEGFTPLHSALASGNSDSVSAYLDVIQQAVTEEWLKHGAYVDLLLSPNKEGFTPLHSALVSGNSENVSAYLDEVRHAVQEEWKDL